ncbi:hypothetical protein T492DRAFT_881206 [Pavlovales sp. CCMP2436]|nr:hypothetical protein T492DRAFT_881206 [Pavlovales sp. CCMP2436]
MILILIATAGSTAPGTSDAGSAPGLPRSVGLSPGLSDDSGSDADSQPFLLRGLPAATASLPPSAARLTSLTSSSGPDASGLGAETSSEAPDRQAGAPAAAAADDDWGDWS